MWEMWVLSLGQKDPLEKGIAAHSCLENSMDRGTWQATVHGGVHSPAHLPFCKAWLTHPPHTQYLQTSPAPPPRSLYHYPAVLPSWNECLPPTLPGSFFCFVTLDVVLVIYLTTYSNPLMFSFSVSHLYFFKL